MFFAFFCVFGILVSFLQIFSFFAFFFCIAHLEAHCGTPFPPLLGPAASAGHRRPERAHGPREAAVAAAAAGQRRQPVAVAGAGLGGSADGHGLSDRGGGG